MTSVHLAMPLVLALLVSVDASATPGKALPGMKRVQSGSFHPVYARPGEQVAIRAFAIDSTVVSARAFFGDATIPAHKALTNVSAAAAARYCQGRGGRLPTTDEWEYVARASENDANATGTGTFKQRVLELALKARSTIIGSGIRNVWGIRDLHGGVHEWTSDYSTAGTHTEHHGGHSLKVTCASGAVQTGDASDYAAFIRHSRRSSSNGKGAPDTGFRCAVSL